MKKGLIVLLMVVLLAALSAVTLSFTKDGDKPVFIPPSVQRTGNAAKGYEYLTTGDFLKSGVPYTYYIKFNGINTTNYLNRTGKNANVDHGFNVITNKQGVEIVIPTCLQCHAQVFEDTLMVGMGNTFIDFSNTKLQDNLVSDAGVKFMQAFSPKSYNAAKAMIRSFKTVYPLMETEVRGVNAADRLATLLVAHRDPQTLQWSDAPILDIPDITIPTDVPAWWMLKKKNAMFYNGFGRGDFGKFLMLSNILTTADSAEAREVNSHFGDVLAYIRSIEPPKYPKPVNAALAAEGEAIFVNNCSKCHGTYGSNTTYPNLLIPASIIQTDSLLFKANYQNPQFIEWFNKSWFAQGNKPARLEPANGYVAPPLDGVWATAPYLHNGSVPTIEALLNSSLRPAYWSRDFKKPVYDYDKLGWKYEAHTTGGSKKKYNTTLPGYSNAGHYFGDKLTNQQRTALLEYLKTL